ncbi:MAG TPA: ATP-binding protein [Pyrinomonadaceae bacterium]|jgi:hypothetical protein|nr:ATP-binding protein [Pyrinomonadaceae bacterium]
MSTLNDDLALLYQLNNFRERAKKLRRAGLAALKGIQNISVTGKITPKPNDDPKQAAADKKYYDNWITSGNVVEAALLVRVQNHRDMSDEDKDNDEASASAELNERLESITLKSLFPSMKKTIEVMSGQDGRDTDEYIDIRVHKKGLGGSDTVNVTERFIEFVDSTVPVLTAGRVMHALVGRAETVFSRATMICYYRIVRELYLAAQPDWVIGAARANAGGDASAFVTSECIRAILAFENSIIRTVAFFRNTRDLLRKHEQLQKMLNSFGVEPEHPLRLWADKAIERMWLDWYISTNPRRGEIAVKQVLTELPEKLNMETVGAYLKSLPDALELYVKEAKAEIDAAGDEIQAIRSEQNPYENAKDGKVNEEEERLFQQSESAHKVAYRAVWRGTRETENALNFFKDEDDKKSDLDTVLGSFIEQFEDISRRIHRVLEPSKRYVRNVVHRELAFANMETGRFDAGELAFAAASFGATTDWRKNERLTMACDLLARSLPDSGSLPTRRPFHSNTRGYRLLPIGCEMARSLAQLMQRSGYAFEPKLINRMLNIFEEKRLPLPLAGEDVKRLAWNFEGAPHPDKPCAWVTAVAVLALDRIVRMLNDRINAIVLNHFEVIRPENTHTNLTLNSLLYPDYGVSTLKTWSNNGIGVSLEQMRAHVQRAMLPKAYKDKSGRMENIFSVILYGPPGTGKTTLVEALALSSRAPLIRLSPSDLTVQGHELIEGRARAVFEALSMLTQCVIILDEFEPVLRARDSEREGSDSQADDPIFNFLVTGMLPKLVKLHDAAKKQSLVYCLATNFIEKIDDAAKRSGRFDLRLPIYHPDPLSRAGEFLYRAVEHNLRDPEAGSEQRKEQKERLLDVVRDTAYMGASELAQAYFRVGNDSSCFKYYFSGGADRGYQVKKSKKWDTVGKFSEEEVAERKAINEWEERQITISPRVKEDEKLSFCISPEAKPV